MVSLSNHFSVRFADSLGQDLRIVRAKWSARRPVKP